MSPYDDGVPAGSEPDRDSALSLPSRIAVVLTGAAVSAAVAVHLSLVFLHVAPPNTVSKQHERLISGYVRPEFEQNWKLFAPDPLQRNIAVQARLDLLGADGNRRATDWTDLTAQDIRAIRHNPAPSHTQQNELRRAWDFYAGSHDAGHRPTGPRGRLSEAYIRRIALLRLGPASEGDQVLRIQIRSVTTAVETPAWSAGAVTPPPVVRRLPWWPVGTGTRP